MAEENKRINEILDIVQKAARGNLSAQAEISDKNDEYDSLAMGINMMIDDIRTSIEKKQAMVEEVRAANEELQATNEELNAVNEELKASNEELITANEEIKQAKEALEESEIKYRHLFENSQVGMYRSRIDGAAILDVNQKWLEMIGYSKEEVIEKPSPMVWARPEKREPFIQQLKEKGGVVDYEMELLTKGGKIRNCLLSTSIYPAQGVIEGTIIDITERKKMEEEIKSKMAELKKQQEIFIGREKRIIEIKKEVNALLKELGRKEKYGSL